LEGHLEASAGAAARSGIVLEAHVAGVAGGGVVGSDENVIRGEGAVNGAGGGGGGVEISGAGGGQRGKVRPETRPPSAATLLACNEASRTTVRSPAV
jgi:hypothetical protein